LNLNVLMSSFGKKHTDRGYKSVYHGLYDVYFNGNPNPDYNVSLFITLAMGLVNVCGYITIAAFLATTEVPLVVSLMDKLIKDAEYASPVSTLGEDFGLKVTYLCVVLHAPYFPILLRFSSPGSVGAVSFNVPSLHVHFSARRTHNSPRSPTSFVLPFAGGSWASWQSPSSSRCTLPTTLARSTTTSTPPC